jgi:hypothetical protein
METDTLIVTLLLMLISYAFWRLLTDGSQPLNLKKWLKETKRKVELYERTNRK